MAPSASNQFSIVTAAVAAAAATGMLLWHQRRCRREESSSSVRIPSSLLESPYSKELKLAVELAFKAGQNMVGYVESKGTDEETLYNLEIETKSGSADFCTKVDIENENLIIDGIRKCFSNHDIIGEETTGTGPVPPLTSVPTWIIDPIDGTTNFSSGLNMTCVSIAFCKDKRPVMGVIYAPITNEWYLAVKGHGAYRNGKRITQRCSNNNKSFQQSVICCEFGYSRKQTEIDAMLGAVSRILAEGCRGIRQLGSGCLDLCYVATGRLDVVYAGIVNEGWKPWDYAAALVICQESGCIMESITPQPAGEEFDLYSKSILCGATRELVDECRSLLLKQ